MRIILISALAALCFGDGVQAAPQKPNVVFILIDDLGGKDLGCYGSRFYRTPHLDRLAAVGMRFTDAYAACPVCSPTRAAIMTGKYPARLNLTDWLPGRPDRPDQKLLRPVIRQELPLEEVTVAKALKSAGYATGLFGKWHLGGAGFEPQRQGFDLNVGGDQAGSPRSYFAPFRDRQGHFMPGLEQASAGEYLTDRLTAEVERFITANRDRPFFVYLAHYAVHIPLKAQAERTAHYRSDGRPGVQNNPIYAAMIESVDDSVGRIMKKLDDLSLSERTLVIFTSDNGGLATLEGPNTPATNNAPLREGKGYLYEGGIRVPLMIRLPGMTQPGAVCTVPVSSIDFFPTILEVCGVENQARVDGLSLAPLLRGDNRLKRDALYWHYPHYCNQGGKPGSTIRAGDSKLIEFFEDGRLELYDLKADVSESNNLIEQKPALAKELHAKLVAWRKAVGARPMTPNPAFRPNPQAADGTITLPAHTADIHGVQLRYEPLPHKNTLGFWTRTEDWASWDFEASEPGNFSVEILQGCGTGQGGSVVQLAVAEQIMKVTVKDTGHFQNFEFRKIGTVKLSKPGRYTLTVKPQSKSGIAVMDLRAVVLKPARS
jgi:arylsulfatase A-like enzyme